MICCKTCFGPGPSVLLLRAAGWGAEQPLGRGNDRLWPPRPAAADRLCPELQLCRVEGFPNGLCSASTGQPAATSPLLTGADRPPPPRLGQTPHSMSSMCQCFSAHGGLWRSCKTVRSGASPTQYKCTGTGSRANALRYTSSLTAIHTHIPSAFSHRHTPTHTASPSQTHTLTNTLMSSQAPMLPHSPTHLLAPTFVHTYSHAPSFLQTLTTLPAPAQIHTHVHSHSHLHDCMHSHMHIHSHNTHQCTPIPMHSDTPRHTHKHTLTHQCSWVPATLTPATTLL